MNVEFSEIRRKRIFAPYPTSLPRSGIFWIFGIFGRKYLHLVPQVCLGRERALGHNPSQCPTLIWQICIHWYLLIKFSGFRLCLLINGVCTTVCSMHSNILAMMKGWVFIYYLIVLDYSSFKTYDCWYLIIHTNKPMGDGEHCTASERILRQNWRQAAKIFFFSATFSSW